MERFRVNDVGFNPTAFLVQVNRDEGTITVSAEHGKTCTCEQCWWINRLVYPTLSEATGESIDAAIDGLRVLASRNPS